MAVLDYSNLAAMNSLASELSGGLTPTDLDSLLSDSAATHTNDTITVYRPYFVAAKMLDRVANTKRIRSARGAEFDRPSVQIRSLLKQQAALDAKLREDHSDYTIPDGMQAYQSAQLVF